MFPGKTFNPRTAQFTFRLAMSDYGAALILPKLVKRLRQEAPLAELIVTQGSREEMIRRVADGELDIAIGVFPVLPPELHAALLIEERFVCIADRANPTLRKGRLSLDAYLDAPHIVVSVRGEAVEEVDVALKDLGKRRQVSMILPHFLVAPMLVPETDLILTLASRAIDPKNIGDRLTIVDPPLPLSSFSFAQIWHERTLSSRAHAWLRQQIADCCAASTPDRNAE
jgi:DNA-binding transcriptional LysR family regulator